MRAQTGNNEDRAYRLAVLSPGSRRVLAQIGAADVCLPRVRISRWARPAAEIQKVLAETWGVRSFVLDFLKDLEDTSSCAVVRLLHSIPPKGLSSVVLDAISEFELSASERATIEAICDDDSGDRGPFSRIGWLDEAMNWICQATERDIQFTGEITQYNAGGEFALVRFATRSGPAHWLKATGASNLHEFDITAILDAACPKYLPPIVAMRRDWNAWLMEEAGLPLGQTVDLPLLERVVRSMADLQKKMVNYTSLLLAAGATNLKMAALRGYVSEIICYLEGAMAQQSSAKVEPIKASRLREIGAILLSACDAMEELAIPETLVHNDINRGNILVRNSNCVFIDWCEVQVGNPFSSLEHLLLLLSPDGGSSRDSGRVTLFHTYKQFWLDSATSRQIDRAFALAPLLAIASYLYGRGDWLRSPRGQDPHVQSYARSLARHMNKAAQNPLLMEALCR
jgi:Phosphotransferase enzyme family